MLIKLFLFFIMSLTPVTECPEQVTQVPPDPAAWGYYHLDMTERICAVTIVADAAEYVYVYDNSGDADFVLDWMGPNMLWIDNPGGLPIDGVTYWVGSNGQAVRLFLPHIQRP